MLQEILHLRLLISQLHLHEQFVLFYDGLLIHEVLLLHHVTQDALSVRYEAPIQSLYFIIVLLVLLGCLFEYVPKLSDCALLIGTHLRLNDPVDDSLTDLLQNVAQSYHASRILDRESLSKLLSSLFPLATTSSLLSAVLRLILTTTSERDILLILFRRDRST